LFLDKTDKLQYKKFRKNFEKVEFTYRYFINLSLFYISMRINLSYLPGFHVPIWLSLCDPACNVSKNDVNGIQTHFHTTKDKPWNQSRDNP